MHPPRELMVDGGEKALYDSASTVRKKRLVRASCDDSAHIGENGSNQIVTPRDSSSTVLVNLPCRENRLFGSLLPVGGSSFHSATDPPRHPGERATWQNEYANT